MGFRSSFRANVVARVTLLALLLCGLAWSLVRTSWDAVPLVCSILLALLAVELVRYVETVTRDLSRLLRSVAAGDYTTALARHAGRAPFTEYQQASECLIQNMRALQLRRAASDELLRAMLEHAGAALLCFTSDGRIVFANAQVSQLLGVAIGERLSSLSDVDPDLPGRLQSTRDGVRLQCDVKVRGEPATLLLEGRSFMLLDKAYTAVVLHDIRAELESRDVVAWQSLTRVLTHEMMNSLTPIVTLSSHLRDALDRDKVAADAVEGVDVIHERSNGLVRFIGAYRVLANPPDPQLRPVPSRTLLDHVARLKGPELHGQGIALDVVGQSPDVTVFVDARQIEQLLINLVTNAQQSLPAVPGGHIELRSETDARGRVLIHVTDNGPGVPDSLLSQVFMPFFSTREGGSGIGLALARQLAGLSRGSLTVSSRPGHCRFTLRLPPHLEAP